MDIKKSKLIVKIKSFFSRFRKIKSDNLENVTGAGEPESFDWKPKGYETPTKPKQDDGWDFQPIGSDSTLKQEDINLNIKDSDLTKVAGGKFMKCPGCGKPTFAYGSDKGHYLFGKCISCGYKIG